MSKKEFLLLVAAAAFASIVIRVWLSYSPATFSTATGNTPINNVPTGSSAS